ncbi:MAG: DUF4240 domain-containing protein [Chitinophagaceae bacterium]
MNKHFTNTKAGANKFWSVTQKNKTLIIRFGRIGTAGQQIKKEFASKAICKLEAGKLLKEKIRRGYKEVKNQPAVLPKTSNQFSPITKQTFWQLINTSLQKTTLDRQAGFLVKELKKLPEKDIAAFENIYNRLDNACYTWNLWAAAYTIHRGCSDDSFADFRAWLITRGEAVYIKALAASDSLAVLKRKKLEQSRDGECVSFLASKAYEDLFDKDIASSKYIKFFQRKAAPSGREWDEGSISGLAKINPALFRLFKKKWQ